MGSAVNWHFIYTADNINCHMSLDLNFFIYGVRHSEYSCNYLSRLLALGHRPSCILSIDSSRHNQAASRSLMARIGEQYPLQPDSWETSSAKYCLLDVAAQQRIPYLALADFQCPHLELYLRQQSPAVILATDGPIVRGYLLYAARHGILSVHAAQLPTFRGNWTTYFNLYHNVPLVASAFIMQPWVDEGSLVGFRTVPVRNGMDLNQINESALQASVELAGEVLQNIACGSLTHRRQEPWEGETYRGCILNNALLPAMPLLQQQQLSARLQSGQYGFYTETV